MNFCVVIKTVNFIKSSALNFRVFQKLCEDLNSDHNYPVYRTKVRCLQRGNLVARVFELRDELKVVLEAAKPAQQLILKMVKFVSCRAYLADIFEVLNLKVQGKGKITFSLWT